jgi:hypothetical protein
MIKKVPEDTLGREAKGGSSMLREMFSGFFFYGEEGMI